MIEFIFCRTDEDEIKDSRPSSIYLSKVGPDDVQLHVQSDHGTGGHWCTKIFFFSLLVVLLGLICLILMENRGLADRKLNWKYRISSGFDFALYFFFQWIHRYQSLGSRIC